SPARASATGDVSTPVVDTFSKSTTYDTCAPHVEPDNATVQRRPRQARGPFVMSSTRTSFPNGSSTIAHLPMTMSKGSTTTVQPAATAASTALGTSSTR